MNDRCLYEEYLRAKYREHYEYSGWTIRGSLLDAIDRQQFKASPVLLLDQRLKQIAADSAPAGTVGIAGKRPGTVVLLGFRAASSAQLHQESDVLGAWLLRQSSQRDRSWKEFCTTQAMDRLGKPLPLIDLDNEKPKAAWVGKLTREFGRWHHLVYVLFLMASLGCIVPVVWNEPLFFAAPMLVFLANIALNSWLLNIQGRYMLALEVMLVFQTMLGLHFLVRCIKRRNTSKSNAWGPSDNALAGSG